MLRGFLAFVFCGLECEHYMFMHKTNDIKFIIVLPNYNNFNLQNLVIEKGVIKY